MVAHGREGGGVADRHVSGVDDAPHARRLGCRDDGAVLRKGIAASGARVRGDDEHLLGVGESGGQAGGIGEVAAPHLHAAAGNVAALRRIAHAATSYVASTHQHLLGDPSAQLAARPCHHDRKLSPGRV